MQEVDQFLSSRSVSEISDASTSASQEPRKVYTRRWLILCVVSVTTALKSFNQSSFGTVNNVYAKYFYVLGWQIDWFSVVQSVIYMALSLPMAIVMKNVSLRPVVCLGTSAVTLGYALTAASLMNRAGYPLMVIAQAIMGFSSLLLSAIPPEIAAVWFPSHEVAIAVSVQVLAQGFGSGLGCAMPPFLVTTQMEPFQVRNVMASLYGGLMVVNAGLFVYSVAFFKSRPPTPPSDAQEKVVLAQDVVTSDVQTLLKSFWSTVKLLCSLPSFVVVCFIFGASPAVIKTSTILLSSMLQKRFTSHTKLNKHAGLALATAYAAYSLGSLIAGHIVTKFPYYKQLVTCCVVALFGTCLLTTIGIACENIYAIYAAMLLQGFSLGIAGTATYELLVEITYPEPTTFASLVGMTLFGIFRLIYPIAGRELLERVGPIASTSIPLITTFLLFISILSVTTDYRRQLANVESQRLLE